MFCPVCATDLILAERQGVEVKVCPICRGMWIEPDELDEIIERSADLLLPGSWTKTKPAIYFDDFVGDDFQYERRRAKKDKKQRNRSAVKELYDIFD